MLWYWISHHGFGLLCAVVTFFSRLVMKVVFMIQGILQDVSESYTS